MDGETIEVREPERQEYQTEMPKRRRVAVQNRPLHPALPPLPRRIKMLPVDERGYPVPWFVQWFHADGSPCRYAPDPFVDHPDFRVADARKKVAAVQENLCWVCGEQLGKYLAFTIGPMCAVNRVSSEPPAHRECAEFSARACPFLTKPKVVRRENDITPRAEEAPGQMLMRNPGVALVWVTLKYKILHTSDPRPGGFLLQVGPPACLFWYCEGREATRAEVAASILSGLPALRDAAEAEGPEAVKNLQRQIVAMEDLLPHE